MFHKDALMDGGKRNGDAMKATQEPAVVQDQYKWTLYQSQVNLPAALNDPRLNRRETDFFTKTWGELFDKTHVDPSTHLPHITHDHFKKYLRKISLVRNAYVAQGLLAKILNL